jgi:head-tail adaptor
MLPNWFMHPRMMATLFPMMVSTGTIQQATEVRDAAGQPIKTWVDLAGHVAIPCHIETTGGSETKASNQVYATATHEIVLQGYYPLITPKMHLVDNAGAVYDILLVDQESFGTFTKLIVEIKH